MAGIRDIRKILDQYPDIKYRSTDLDIQIPKTNETGYEIYLKVEAEGITLYCDGWHHEYDSIESAWPDFVASLTPRWRFKITVRGKSRHKWEQEIYRDGKWRKGWIVSMLFYPFWKSAETSFLQNEYFTDDDEIENFYKLLDGK